MKRVHHFRKINRIFIIDQSCVKYMFLDFNIIPILCKHGNIQDEFFDSHNLTVISEKKLHVSYIILNYRKFKSHKEIITIIVITCFFLNFYNMYRIVKLLVK